VSLWPSSNYEFTATLEGISTFASLEFVDEVKEGCQRLRNDLGSGRIYEILSKYGSTAGDYMFIVAQKGRGFGR